MFCSFFPMRHLQEYQRETLHYTFKHSTHILINLYHVKSEQIKNNPKTGLG